MRETSSQKRVLIVGVGGLGCPVALSLAAAGVGTLGLVDDDLVELTNLHRQILFDASMLGQRKVDAAAAQLERQGVAVLRHPLRFVPENAIDIVTNYDLIIDAADNYATKFLIADVAARCQKPVVHASAERWSGFVLAIGASQSPCYRCLFEDIPIGPQRNCNDSGVVGACLGVIGAVQADLALRLLESDAEAAGTLFQFDGLVGHGRTHKLPPRKACALCNMREVMIDRARYTANQCAVN